MTAMDALGQLAVSRRGMFTTRQALEAGVSRQNLHHLTTAGRLERLHQGVYRITNVPDSEHEDIYATWLALGLERPRDVQRQPRVVAAGRTAADLHGIGVFYLDGLQFITPTRRTTRIPGVRLRTRRLTGEQVQWLDGIPTLTVEATIVDLVNEWEDLSNVAECVADAVDKRTLKNPEDLAAGLEPIARAHGHSGGRTLADHLFELAGRRPEGQAA